MVCDYCAYRNSWDCDDGYNRRKNCSEFKLDWDSLPNDLKGSIREIISNAKIDDWWEEI